MNETREVRCPHSYITNHQGNANQNSHLLGSLLSTKQEITFGPDLEEREPMCTVDGNINGRS